MSMPFMPCRSTKVTRWVMLAAIRAATGAANCPVFVWLAELQRVAIVIIEPIMVKETQWQHSACNMLLVRLNNEATGLALSQTRPEVNQCAETGRKPWAQLNMALPIPVCQSVPIVAHKVSLNCSVNRWTFQLEAHWNELNKTVEFDAV